MTDILTTAALLARGFEHEDLERLQRSGALVRVRRGAYALPDDEALAAEAQHRRLIEATLPQLRRAGVVSHLSAAVLHGLPVWAASLDHVHLTRTRVGGGRTRTIVQVHTSPLAEDEVVPLDDDTTVTSLARTVVDLARTLPLDQSVAAADRALAVGLDRDHLAEVAERARGWPQAGRARFLAGFADGRSESAGESVSRLRLH